MEIRNENFKFHKGHENLKLIHLSDFHLPFSINRIKNVTTIIQNSECEIIAMTGDYVDSHKGVDQFVHFIKQIVVNKLVLFVLGNHDKRFKTILLKQLNLINNCICIDEKPHHYTSSLGYNYVFTSWNQRSRFTPHKNTRQIVLLHNPKAIKESELGHINLILAGHIHGGQFILWKTKSGKNFPGCLLYKYCADQLLLQNTAVIISRGLGDTLPIRINCPHELINIQIT